MERQWRYLAPGADQKGPFPESVLLRMLVKGIPGLALETYAWCDGMEEWAPLSGLEPFKGVMAAQTTMWHYLDESQQQQGPLDAQAVSKLWDEGQIDGMTMVWNPSMPEWKSVAEVQELKQLLQILSSQPDDEEEAEGGVAGGQMTEDMVFQSEEIPTLSSVFKENGSSKEEAVPHKKSFVADNGVRYRFNPHSQDWEEADSGYESDDEDGGSDNGDEQNLAATLAKAKKGEAGEGGGKDEKDEKKKKKKKKNKKRGLDWDDKAKNRWVYVSGLPSDITVQELDQHFRQCGVIAIDAETSEPKIKLYRDEQGVPKGDASISYVKSESVELAIEILHDGYLRPNVKISVTKAVFQKKGDTFVAKKTKVSEAKKKVAKQAMAQALTWAEEDDSGLNRSKALRIVVLRNMFHPEDCKEKGFVEDLQRDLDRECSACGPVEKITVFERHPEGVVIVKFATAYAADQCTKLMNNRKFRERQLKCNYWDGETDFTKVVYVPSKTGEGGGVAGPQEMDEDEERRLDEFGDELDNQELPDEFALEVEGE